MKQQTILDIVRKLFPFAYSVVSKENDRAIGVFLEELNFDIVEIPSGHEHNGWTVPNDWRVISAYIFKDGKIILDGLSSPLGVGVLSPSFSGAVSVIAGAVHA